MQTVNASLLRASYVERRTFIRRAVIRFSFSPFKSSATVSIICANPFPLPGQYAAFTAFIEPGDEVIIFEPFFDQYLPSVAFNGGKCVYVPLHPSAAPAPGVQIGKQSWDIDFNELRCVPVWERREEGERGRG